MNSHKYILAYPKILKLYLQGAIQDPVLIILLMLASTVILTMNNIEFSKTNMTEMQELDIIGHLVLLLLDQDARFICTRYLNIPHCLDLDLKGLLTRRNI